MWDRSYRFILTDRARYPITVYTYQFDGGAMRADPKLDQYTRAGTAMEFVSRLVNPPFVGQRDFVAMFIDAGEGEAAWKVLGAGRVEPFGGGKVEHVSGDADQTFRITDRNVQVMVRVVKGAEDFRIHTFELIR